MAAVRREPRPGQGAPGAQPGKPGTVSAPAVPSQRTDRHWRWPGSVRQPGRRERRPGFPRPANAAGSMAARFMALSLVRPGDPVPALNLEAVSRAAPGLGWVDEEMQLIDQA